MSFAKVYSAQTALLKAHTITIEVDLSKGLHAFSIVGLPDKAVEESRDRVSAAIKNSGFKSPKQKNQKIVISLAPADLKKEGPLFDLGMAVAYLLAAKEIRFKPEGKLFLGELSLDGDVRPVRGVLPLAVHAGAHGFKQLFVPKENAREAALIDGIDVRGVGTLSELLDHIDEKREKQKHIDVQPPTEVPRQTAAFDIDFADIRGQDTAKRGLEIAAAGGHNIALFGPPGTGKTLLAKAFAHILPPLSFPDMLEVTSIHSVAGHLDGPLMTRAPFRAPHHTSSYVSVVGGGTVPRPGEATLAHRGVLFLDEFPEFDRRVLESLREPLEERMISVARAKGSATFPAGFILVAAMNPCPCGNFGVSSKECICAPAALERYRRKVSGPIIDRIDMWIEVAHIPQEQLSRRAGESESVYVVARVQNARARQAERFQNTKHLNLNSDMSVKDLDKHITLANDIQENLNRAAAQMNLSPRSYHRVIKLARTIADLDESKDITGDHVMEALHYRPKQQAL